MEAARAGAGQLASVELDGARGDRSEADQRFDQLVLAVAGDPGNAEDLAGAHLESHVVDDFLTRASFTWRPVTVSIGSAGWLSPRSTVSWTSRPTMSSARSSSSVSDGIREPTTLPRRMTVMRSAISRTS